MKQLNETPRPPKIADPYHYYNVAAVGPATPFYKITNMFMEDRSPPHIYMHKFDRSAHMHLKAVKNHRPYKIARAKPKNSVLVGKEPKALE
jgi:hypothetical protein